MDTSTEKTANTSCAVSKMALLTMALLMFSVLSTPASAVDNFAAISGGKCVKDKTTGLIWERKTNSGLRDKDHKYTWFSKINNGGDAGWKDLYGYDEIKGWLGDSWAPKYRGATCGGTLKACNTADYVKAVNRQGLCGYKDWRLPTKQELMSIIDKRKPGCSSGDGFMPTEGYTKKNVFPNTVEHNDGSGSYWSSSPYAYKISHAWAIDFYYGDEAAYYKYDVNYVRLVRSGE